MPLAAGTTLGQYEIRSALGAGGMGEVYRAYDNRLQREVAIKVLPESLTSDLERLRRFEQEARVVAALNHPNILAVFQMGNHGDINYMVTELLDGETLRLPVHSCHWGVWMGIAPDDSPLLLRDAGSTDVYSLDWQEP